MQQDELSYHHNSSFLHNHEQFVSQSVTIDFTRPQIQLIEAESIDFLFREYIREDAHMFQYAPEINSLPENSLKGHDISPLLLTESTVYPMEKQPAPHPVPAGFQYKNSQPNFDYQNCAGNLVTVVNDRCSSDCACGSSLSDNSAGSPRSTKTRNTKNRVQKRKVVDIAKNKFSLLFRQSEKVDLQVFVMTKCPFCPKLFKAVRGFKSHITKHHPRDFQ
ncbi:hypothetical protein HDV01_000852 [Terramyces sp. JEL0728]|nr:hypothetical protein HDV01_000852 [Terramyces sp. JEL0728]